jgi:hypothetical protein
MTVANEQGHWWAYCQACKKGARLTKEHVLLSTVPEHRSESLSVPTDRVQVLGSVYEAAVGAFLASKRMMYPYLPELFISPRTKRLLMQEGADWHGRDMLGRSAAKWMHYGSPGISGIPKDTTIVTEDIFSMFKVRYALRDLLSADHDLAVVCSLGAGVGDKAVLALRNCHRIVWAYDADGAGDEGARNSSVRMSPFVRKQNRARPPDGLDPKDMTSEEIRSMMKGIV